MDIQLQVQVPSHSISFDVALPPSATVLDLKQAIRQQCPGTPSIQGQRLILNGRLLQETEIASVVWNSPTVSRVVFVAVHPSAWTSAPPNSASSSQTQRQDTPTTPQSIPTAVSFNTIFPRTSQELRRRAHDSNALPLTWVHHLHTNAIRAVMKAPFSRFETSSVTNAHFLNLRNFSRTIVESYGYQWPTILDEDFPGPLANTTSGDEGVAYSIHYVEGKPYLRLNPESKGKPPTALQQRAFEILKFTFPLLHITYTQSFFETYRFAPLNPQFAPMGLVIPPGPVRWNQVIPRNIQAFPYRALIGPLFMLCLRTTILLYIFTPSTPILAIVMCGWVAWEIWGVAQAIVAHEAAAAANRPNNGNANAAVPAAAAAAQNGVPLDIPIGGAPPAAGQANVAQPNVNLQGGPLMGFNAAFAGNSPAQILDKLAQFNLKEEDRALFPPSPDPHPQYTLRLQREPSPFHRIKMLVVLFILTMHPGIWLRRRTSLRTREGNVKKELHEKRQERERDEASQNATTNSNGAESSQPQPTPTTTPAREFPQRPPWMEAYFQRVEQAEWVDG